MKVTLRKTGIEDDEKLWRMQVEAFQSMYEKYQDTETSPAAEGIEKTQMRLNQSFTYYYYIEADNEIVGAIRIVSIPALIEPPVRSLGATLPAAQSHPSGGGNHHSGN